MVTGRSCTERLGVGVLRVSQKQRDDGYLVLELTGELDAFTVASFRHSFADLFNLDQLVMDLSGVVFIDSAGLGALIGAIRRTRESGGRVGVACNRPGLTRVFHRTGFDRIVKIAPSVDDAVDAIDGSQGVLATG